MAVQGMERMAALLTEGENWLMQRVLHYAKLRGYTRYTSTLEEAWRMSIAGLSQSLLSSLQTGDGPAEFGPDDDYTNDPVAAFGVLEARRHRARGVTLSMFLGLTKYYRQSYLDLLGEADLEPENRERCLLFVQRFFDLLELGYCVEWAEQSDSELIVGLQAKNRAMTNEKNKYLTIYESLPIPVVLLDEQGMIDSLNRRASEILPHPGAHFSSYYGADDRGLAKQPLPWLKEELSAFLSSRAAEVTFERELQTSHGPRHFEVKLKRMLDVSDKFAGAVLFLGDITDRKRSEERLSFLAQHDPLTNLPNRRLLEEALSAAIARAQRGETSSLLFMDVDRFKTVNDTLGHAFGDRVLVALVGFFQTQLRDHDIVFRLGGDEFVVLLSGTGEAEAEVVAERVLAVVEQLPLVLEGFSFPLTLSIGVVTIDRQRSLAEVLSQGDDAMYRAKRAGRNQVRVYRPEEKRQSARARASHPAC